MSQGDNQLERVVGMIERATDTYSKQPRFDDGQKKGFGGYISLAWLQEMQPPEYRTDSRMRDTWLRSVWKLVPHLAGVMNSVTLIDSNRGWELTGGRNQVARYTRLLHDAENGQGWRMYARKASLSYWATDIGAITELGSDTRGGPVRALYHVDSARCKLLSGGRLAYYPSGGGKEQTWEPEDYFRAASMPSDDEAYNGLGFCAVSRAIEIMRLLYAVMVHDQELVSARAPRGLLLLQGITQDQWDESLAVRDEKLDSLERRYYAGVQVLATMGVESPDAKLVGLSQLPQSFDAKVFNDLSMYAIALCFGYDPSEFWPVQFGSIGRGTEAEMQHEKATGKGGMDFALATQEQLQGVLPETLQFEYEQRDDSGEMTASQVARSKLEVVSMAYQSGLSQGAPLVSREEAREMLVEAGLIPAEWTNTQEDVSATDTEDVDDTEGQAVENEPIEQEPQGEKVSGEAERALDSYRVRQALREYPSEPIVRYQWPSGKMKTLYVPKRRVWAISREALYEDDDFTITSKDMKAAQKFAVEHVSPEFAGLFHSEPYEGENG